MARRCRNLGMEFSHELKLTYLRHAYNMALLSPDPSTQNGSILVNSTGTILSRGYNGFPEGVNPTSARLERPLKYAMVEHAERWAIFSAARLGRSTQGGTLICPFIICADCARAVISVGIRKVIGHSKMSGSDRWGESISIGITMLQEAGVEIEWLDGDLGCSPIRFNGELFHP